jgi:hypothetical protein
MSIHPTMTDAELAFILDGVEALAKHHQEWISDYDINLSESSIQPKNQVPLQEMQQRIDAYFQEDFVKAPSFEHQ